MSQITTTSSYGTIDLGSDNTLTSSDSCKLKKIWTTSTKERPKLTSPSTGVTYDIHNHPISANTFGSVNPDVNSDIDLNTTSETEVEDRKQYEPNILEKALERTICYHMKRRPKASRLTTCVLSFLALGFHTAVLVVTPIYVSSIKKRGGDEGVVLLSLAACVPPLVVLMTLLLKHIFDKSITLKPTASTFLYIGLGLCLALRLNIGVFTSHPDRTPWSIQPVLASSFLAFAIFLYLIGLCKKISCRRLCCAIFVLVSVFICVEPRVWSLEGSDDEAIFDLDDDPLEQMLWAAGYTLSFLPLAVYFVLAEHELKKHKIHSCSLSASGILVASVFTVLMAFADFIPKYGRVDTFEEGWDNIKDVVDSIFGNVPDDNHCLICLVIFVGAVIGSNLFSFLLITASEGTVFLAMVTTLSSHLAAGFWTLFHYDYDDDVITWRPEWTHTSIFVVVSLAMGVPSVITYAVFSIKDIKKAKSEQKGYSDVSSSEYEWE